MTFETALPAAASRAVLVSLQLPGVSDAELTSSLDELARLAETLGLEPIVRLTQHRRSSGDPGVLGAGKLKELARLTGGTGLIPQGASRRQTGSRPAEAEEPDEEQDDDSEEAGDGETLASGERASVVLFDHDLSPSQLRNLEGATGAQVLDRSSVILGIFQRHARTREARLQVEIARLGYLAPRLRGSSGSEDRQRGVIGGRGAGESSLELDRRRVRDRIAELRQELEAIELESRTRRARRRRTDTVALVGYTNAGKSSLMRSLTGSEVLVEDKLFATLDTTVRALYPETRPRILVTDTVGFIKKLPHGLVASFRSTLEEAREATLLLHVVDASDPDWPSQLEVTRTVLAEMQEADVSPADAEDEEGGQREPEPSLLVFNKIDRLDEDASARLAEEHPEAILVSAFRPLDVLALRERILAHFERDMVDGELFVPYLEQRMVHEVHESCRVLRETHDETGTRLRVRAPRALLARFGATVATNSGGSAEGAN